MVCHASANRTYIIDILKIVACFFVFRIHMGEVSPLTPFVQFAVPIFIFLTSYNYTRSSHIRNLDTIKKWFSTKNLLKKFLRLYVPYIFFAVVQLVLIIALNAGYDWGNVILSLFFGGYGPGNYYLLLMFQIILFFPFLLYFNRKNPDVTFIACVVIYFGYHIFMRLVFPDNPDDVTTLGGIINKWTILRWIFLIECGIYFYIQCDSIKWWQLVLFMLVDIVPYILQLTTQLPTLYIRGIPYNFIVAGIVGLCIKYFGNISFGRFNAIICCCGKATWHIFLFQQLYFWLIGLLNWQQGFTYLCFPICFGGGLLFYLTYRVVVRLVFNHDLSRKKSGD